MLPWSKSRDEMVATLVEFKHAYRVNAPQHLTKKELFHKAAEKDSIDITEKSEISCARDSANPLHHGCLETNKGCDDNFFRRKIDIGATVSTLNRRFKKWFRRHDVNGAVINKSFM